METDDNKPSWNYQVFLSFMFFAQPILKRRLTARARFCYSRKRYECHTPTFQFHRDPKFPVVGRSQITCLELHGNPTGRETFGDYYCTEAGENRMKPTGRLDGE